MHDPVVNELEDYLAGKASPAVRGHLASCQECRVEVESMAEVSGLLAELRSDPESAAQPSPFFFTRVAAGIMEHQNTGHWGLLAPGAAFFRRVAFASLLLLAGLGSYLVMREGEIPNSADAVTIIARHDATTDHAASADRDVMLVTLASYGE